MTYKITTPKDQRVTSYWLEFYSTRDGFCTLCGNHGWLDTRGVRTPAGVSTGRVNWCFCPNGQSMRYTIGGDGPEAGCA